MKYFMRHFVKSKFRKNQILFNHEKFVKKLFIKYSFFSQFTQIDTNLFQIFHISPFLL